MPEFLSSLLRILLIPAGALAVSGIVLDVLAAGAYFMVRTKWNHRDERLWNIAQATGWFGVLLAYAWRNQRTSRLRYWIPVGMIASMWTVAAALVAFFPDALWNGLNILIWQMEHWR